MVVRRVLEAILDYDLEALFPSSKLAATGGVLNGNDLKNFQKIFGLSEQGSSEHVKQLDQFIGEVIQGITFNSAFTEMAADAEKGTNLDEFGDLVFYLATKAMIEKGPETVKLLDGIFFTASQEAEQQAASRRASTFSKMTSAASSVASAATAKAASKLGVGGSDKFANEIATHLSNAHNDIYERYITLSGDMRDKFLDVVKRAYPDIIAGITAKGKGVSEDDIKRFVAGFATELKKFIDFPELKRTRFLALCEGIDDQKELKVLIQQHLLGNKRMLPPLPPEPAILDSKRHTHKGS